jgi:DNA-binding transcriptional MerR regulator
MKSSELCNLLNLNDSTLRKYAKEYADYLEPVADGGAGHHRNYSERDARIIKLVLDMKAQRQKPEDIDVTLSSLQSSNWERLPALDEGSQSIIPTPGALITMQNDKTGLQREIDVLREMLEKADERVAEADRRADDRVAKVTADRDEILRRLSEAEQLVRLYESRRLQPPE